MNANVTSLRAHADAVFRVQADVVAMQEVRLSATGQRAMRAQARDHDWECHWGMELDSPTGGVWGATQGGVGLLVRKGWPCRRVEVDKDDALATRLWTSGRWLHVCLALGDGRSTANLQVVYGVSGQPALNAEFFGLVLEYQARLAGSASIIAMDANFNLDVAGTYPTPVLVALARGDLVDLDQLHAAAKGTACASGFSWGESPPTRIDGVLADAGTAGRLVSVGAATDLELPGHTAVGYDLALARAGQRVLKTVRLDPFEVRAMPPGVAENIVAGLLGPHVEGWRLLLQQRDVNGLWARWTWLAEEMGLALSDLALQDAAGRGEPLSLPYAPPTVKRGRGTEAMVREVDSGPAKTSKGRGVRTTPLMWVTGALGSLRTVIEWGRRTVRALPQGPEEGVLLGLHGMSPPVHVLTCWRAACTKCGKLDRWLRDEAPDLADFLPPHCGGDYPLLPPLVAVVEQYDGVVALGRAYARREERRRVALWRTRMEEAWAQSPGKVFDWVKGKVDAPLVMVADPDDGGKPCASIEGMDEILHRAWDPIMRKYADRPEPCPQEFQRRYGQHVSRVPMATQPLTGARLRGRLRKMGTRTARGLDGWAVVDLLQLPVALMDMLADLLGLVEELGEWPVQLARGYISLVPKGEGMGPLQMRPLSVLSQLYRAWAGLRMEESMVWQEEWAHPLSYAFRPKRGALDAASLLALLLELHRLLRRRFGGIGLDYIKCFDLIPQAQLLWLAAEMGMEAGVLRAVAAMYRQLRRCFKLVGCLGSFFAATNGILQGCPLSVIFINLLTTVWKRVIDDLRQPVVVAVRALPPPMEEQPPPCPAPGAPPPAPLLRRRGAAPLRLEVSTMGYADDTYAFAQDGASMAPKMGTISEFLEVTGQGVNAKKSVAFDTTGEQPVGAELGGQPLPLQNEFRVLGAGVRTTGLPGSGPLILKRISEASRMLPRIYAAQGGFDRRAQVVSTLILPAGLHAASLVDIARGAIARLDAAVMRALWGPTRPCRATEVVMAFFCAGHRVLPSMVCDYQRLTWLAARGRTEGPLQLLTQAVWEAGPKRGGPMGRALQTAKGLGWEPLEGWWKWSVPGRTEPLAFGQGTWGAMCHAIRDGLRYRSVQRLVARRPRLFTGLGCVANKQLLPPTLRGLVELDASLLRGAMAGSIWTAHRAHARGLRDSPLCPYCDGKVPETEEHIFYVCPAWEAARSVHLQDLRTAAGLVPALAQLDSWPPCLRLCGLLPEVRLVPPPPPPPPSGGAGPPRDRRYVPGASLARGWTMSGTWCTRTPASAAGARPCRPTPGLIQPHCSARRRTTSVLSFRC